MAKKVPCFHTRAIASLSDQGRLGNVQELEAVIDQEMALTGPSVLVLKALPPPAT
jgi:hypothetical protein